MVWGMQGSGSSGPRQRASLGFVGSQSVSEHEGEHGSVGAAADCVLVDGLAASLSVLGLKHGHVGCV